MLDEILARLNNQSVAPELKQAALEATEKYKFIPSPGPQTDAYFSKADVLLFGGSPGGGKSALEIGLALNEHYRALVIRKNFSDLEGIIDTAKKLAGSSDGFIGGSRPKYRKDNGGVIHFAGLANDGGIGGHQGVDHDLICIDEAAQVPENQVRLLMGWLRTDRVGQRCRIVLGSNPPLDTTGDWLISFFAPWLDPTHPNPAMPGELRYFLPGENGKDVECGKDDFVMIGGVKVNAQSRTFIPSKFTDNPYYNPEEYAKTLSALPEKVREILVTGNFMMARQDDLLQVIPTDWIKNSMSMWTAKPPEGVPQTCMAVDVAQGGTDRTVLAIRYDGWFAPLIEKPGSETPSGAEVAALVVKNRRGQPPVVIDMGGGYGGAAYEHLVTNGMQVFKHLGAAASTSRTSDRTLKFYNKRAEVFWRLREALDPTKPEGCQIVLPNDPELLSDLASIRLKGEITASGIQLESKEDLKDRIGRSPDKGDAVAMCWAVGLKAANLVGGKFSNKKQLTVHVGHANRKR